MSDSELVAIQVTSIPSTTETPPPPSHRWQKTARGAFIAGAGAVLVYVAEAFATADFGLWSPLLTAAASAALNALRQYARQSDSSSR